MARQSKVRVELTPAEIELLRSNVFISSACHDQLSRACTEGDWVVLSLSVLELEYLVGFVASETNHTKDRGTRRALNEICEEMESALCRTPSAK